MKIESRLCYLPKIEKENTTSKYLFAGPPAYIAVACTYIFSSPSKNHLKRLN